QGPTIRVPLEELDALVRMVGEVVVNRSAFQQFFGDLIRQSKDLQLGTLRLRGIAERLENDYEVAALTSTAASAAAAGGGNDNGMLRSVSGEGGAGFDELEFDRYTEFHLLTRELGEAISDLDAIGIEASATIGDFDGAMNRLGRLSGDLEGKLMHVRLVPLASISTRLGRIVRVTAGKLGRRASFALEGGEIGLDKGVLEDILEPLGHLIRNAVDHGLEAPEERLRLGKDPMGSVRISASHEGTQVVIRVSDDGAGIDHDRLRKKAVERDFLSAEDAEKASNDEMRNILFLPGFSTASQLTNISGRGVGLDVVKERVLAMKGSVTIASVAGEGTTFTIRLPMTLAVSRALLVGAAGAKWALPFAYLHEILRVEQGELTVIGEHPVFNYAGRVIRTIFLDQALGYHNDDSRERRAEQPILLIKVADEEIALVVDKIFGGQKIAIKNLGNHLLSVPGVSGATLMGDGSVVLILKPEDLSARAEVSDLVVTRAGIDAASAGRRMEILVVDDSLSVRRVVSQALRGAGWTPVLARDGVEALEALSKSSKTPDLVLLDIEMPRMDGFELSAALQADPRYKNIPIVMLTSRSGKKHRDRGMELGVKEYLVKPYKEEVLLDIVRRLTSAPQDKTTAHLSGA
ncbi:response regulator, partial [Myxococcota bacterium]|nr:response regulator [Myxococcota bacterium]